MSLSSSVSEDEKTVTMLITGRFEFSDHADFRKAYNQIPPTTSNYIVDMAGVEYMDSAALGMLVVLHERTGNDKTRVILKGCNADILKILDISKFDQILTIER
ncbi:MAG: STAS domain-containing protein [Candidatus Polarisedimenticolaceae bacterium]|nr:STAS domain-containing protein [Candidatus Polarisedimenticolaceae bacterium]